VKRHRRRETGDEPALDKLVELRLDGGERYALLTVRLPPAWIMILSCSSKAISSDSRDIVNRVGWVMCGMEEGWGCTGIYV